MTKLKISALLFCYSLLAGTTAYPRQKPSPSPPHFYEDYGACPFECCTYRRWTVNSNTVFYNDRSTSSTIAFRAKKGEYVTGLTGVVITLKPGQAVVKRDTTLDTGKYKVRVKAGDILYLLHYEGEGFYKFWLRGKIHEAEMPVPPDLVDQSPKYKSGEFIQQRSEPQTVWWVKVKNQRGQIGWSKQNNHFDEMDACG